MARGVDSEYIGSLSLMDGFDMGINFDGFGENMKKFMELPIKYLDSAHDKAVGLVEDIHALICTPFPDDELPNKGHGTVKDASSNHVITRSSTTSVEMEHVDPNGEFSSSPTSLITAEDSSLGSIDTDAHETESVSSKCPDSCASEDAISLGRTVSIKQEVNLCNSENLSDSCTPENPISLGRTVSIEEEIILWNPGNSVKPPQPPEPTTIVQDYVSLEVNTDKVMEQVGLHSSGHSESSSNGAILLGKISTNGEERSELYRNDPEESAKHDLQDDQEQMKNNKAEASSLRQPKNTSFKKILMRSLSNKLRWSKKDMNVHQTVPVRPQEAVNVGYQAVSSSDDLEDDWELL